MNIYWVEKKSEGDTELQIGALRQYVNLSGLDQADVIFCASIDAMTKTKEAMDSGKPLAVYCWDYYQWAHDGHHPGSWNWGQYADLLRSAQLVFVPSGAQQKRLKETLGVSSTVVRSGIKVRTGDVRDGGFILDPVRYYPDPNRTWAEDAAKELGIPIIHSEHQYSAEEFNDLVCSCTFMTSCVREASTGGLTLAEGLWLGKRSLVSDSPYMGARDYLGDYGVYFQYDSFEDLKSKMKQMWEDRKSVDASLYLEKNLTFSRMARDIYENLARVTK